jgi:hypothetical protein
MTAETVQLLTTIGSLAVAALGIWVAHKSRQAPLHEALYTRQLESSAEIVRLVGDFTIAVARGIQPPEELHALLEAVLFAQIRLGILLPAPVLFALHAFAEEAGSALASGDLNTPAHRTTVVDQVAKAADRFVLVVRNSLGVGGLSKQTQRFFSTGAERLLEGGSTVE